MTDERGIYIAMNWFMDLLLFLLPYKASLEVLIVRWGSSVGVSIGGRRSGFIHSHWVFLVAHMDT